VDGQIYPKLKLADEFGERDEEEMGARGWFYAEVELENGKIYGLNFYHPVRLKQEFESTIEIGKPCLYEFNIILVPEVTIENIRKSIHYLYQLGYFKFILPEGNQ